MPNPVTNVLIVGVGGQGTLLASRILAQVARQLGHDVKVSEVHGMAQRGGSVVTQVRFGQRVYSPLIAQGEADVILAFEKLEALRWLPYLKAGGQVIINDQSVDPLPVLTGAAKYPEGIPEKIQEVVPNVVVLNATELAIQCGNVRAANVVLLGVLTRLLGFDETVCLQALAKTVPPIALAINEQAFRLGMAAVK